MLTATLILLAFGAVMVFSARIEAPGSALAVTVTETLVHPAFGVTAVSLWPLASLRLRWLARSVPHC